MKRTIAPGVAWAVAGMIFGIAQADASTVTLEPTGKVTNGAYLESYFNGGLDSYAPDGTGPSDNVIFAPLQSPTLQTNWLINGTEIQNANIPSVIAGHNSYNAVLFQSVQSVMNLAPGYVATGLSFEYSIENNSSTYTPTVTMWSGLNGTGTALETFNLAAPTGSSACSGRYEFCSWTQTGANIAGPYAAQSVTFGNKTGTYIGNSVFDSVTLTETTVPLPGSLVLLLSGLAGLGATLRGRRAVSA